MRKSVVSMLSLLVFTMLILVACGGNPGAQAPLATEQSPGEENTTSPPTATSAATGVAPTTAQPTMTQPASTQQASAQPTEQVAATATTAPALTLAYDAWPQSKTPEGYFVLGQPDAPVEIIFYSDFL